MAQCATTALAGAVPWSCVPGARARFRGVGAGAGCCVFPVSPCPPGVSCAVCGGPSRLGVPYPRSLVCHSMRSVRSAGSVRLPFSFSPRVLCVCALALSRRQRPSPPQVGVARALRAVPVLGAGRAIPRGLCPSACPAPVPCSVWLAWGGGGRCGFPLPGLGLRAPHGVDAGVGTRHRPHSTRSCELALRAVGAAREGPGGAPFAWVWGVWGRRLSHPRPLVLSGVRPGPTTHWLWVRGSRAWGSVSNPTARALASWLCALWGRHGGARGRRLLPRCAASGVGRSPSPDHSSFRACGRGPLPTGCGCGGCGRGDPSPTAPGVLLRAGFARCGGGTRAP